MLLQRQEPSTRQLTTAHLAQTMSLLELTAVELGQKIESELASNPALELFEERRCPTCRRVLMDHSPCPFCSRPHDALSDQPIVFLSPREDFFPWRSRADLDEIPAPEEKTPDYEDLPHYVLRQIAPELKPEDRQIAAHILTSLNEAGLLCVHVVEIARFHHLPMDRVTRVIKQIQHADPLGVGSPTPQDALLVQLEVLSETMDVPAMTKEAILQGMALLSRHRYIELGKLLKIPVSQAKEIARFISGNLHPFPAHTHWGDNHNNQQNSGQDGSGVYYFPDIIISRLHEKEDSPLVVEIALPYCGTLRINPLFREALQQAPTEKTEQWRNDLDHAILLVKCLQQRNHTMVRLLQRLIVMQREYILKGDAFLQPITRAYLASELDLHESTISRAVSDKAVQMPNGRISPLSRFFDRSLHIRTELLQIIQQETNPLSDNEIASKLAQKGYPVARRTVAKYRAMEGILPAHLRASAFNTQT